MRLRSCKKYVNDCVEREFIFQPGEKIKHKEPAFVQSSGERIYYLNATMRKQKHRGNWGVRPTKIPLNSQSSVSAGKVIGNVNACKAL